MKNVPSLRLVGSLQVAFAAVHLTTGAGLWCLLACAALTWKPTHGLARLMGATSVALLVALGVGHQDNSGLLALLGVILVMLGSPVASSSAWLPPGYIPVAAGAVGALWMVIPHALPVADTVVPGPWEPSAAAAWSLLAAGVALALWMRRDVGKLGGVGLGVAAAMPLGLTAMLWSAGTGGTQAELLVRAQQARMLGLRALEADLVTSSMKQAETEARWVDLTDIYTAHTQEGDASRLRGEVLRLAAHGLEGTLAPAHDVDAMLQRALRRGDGAAFETWPGQERMVATTLRTRTAPSHDGALDCYGGTWCLLGVALPTTPLPAPALVRWKLVAPPVGDVTTVLQIGWNGWQPTGVLVASEHAVGDVFTQPIVVQPVEHPPAQWETWLRLQPVDGGKPLLLEKKPGSNLVVGTLNPDVTAGTSH